MPFPRPGHDAQPLTGGEWGCLILAAAALLYGIGAALLT
jgi:hypothetical protein